MVQYSSRLTDRTVFSSCIFEITDIFLFKNSGNFTQTARVPFSTFWRPKGGAIQDLRNKKRRSYGAVSVVPDKAAECRNLLWIASGDNAVQDGGRPSASGDKPECGYYCCAGPNSTQDAPARKFPHFRAPMDSRDFFDPLWREAHVAATAGAGFGPSGREYIRAPFGKTDDTAEAVRRMRRVLE